MLFFELPEQYGERYSLWRFYGKINVERLPDNLQNFLHKSARNLQANLTIKLHKKYHCLHCLETMPAVIILIIRFTMFLHKSLRQEETQFFQSLLRDL